MSNRVIATIDLGSNSFHLLISKIENKTDAIKIHRSKQKVQLRSGLTETNDLSQSAKNRALNCLKQFREKIIEHKVTEIKILGTYTLRKAEKQISLFLEEASKTIGARIEVISGEEEARLIYVGASKMAKFDNKQVLIVDIGGGSTELIIGKGSQIFKLSSLEMGCVSIQDRFFSDGNLNEINFNAAISYAKGLLMPIFKDYKSISWQEALGASGTIRSIASVIRNTYEQPKMITKHYLDRLKNDLIKLKKVNAISFKGLRSDRENILPGGFCVLYAIFELFDINSMYESQGALREGMLFEAINQK